MKIITDETAIKLSEIADSLSNDHITSLRIHYRTVNNNETISRLEILSDSENIENYRSSLLVDWDLTDITFDVLNQIYPGWNSDINARGVMLLTSTGYVVIEHTDNIHGYLVGESFKLETNCSTSPKP